MNLTRNQLRQRRRERMVAALIVFGSLLMAICLPHWVEYIIVDKPAGVYAEK